MDPLSDVLRAVRLDGAYFYLVEAGDPWAVDSLPARDLAPRILPGSENLISYHILLSGTCWGGLKGERLQAMRAGDVIVFPHGDAHRIASGPVIGSVDPDGGAAPDRYPSTVRIGSGPTRDTKFVCGFLGCDARPYNPLLASLPSCMVVRGASGGWLSRFPAQVVLESSERRAGAETVLTRMAELMFIEVLRRHIEDLPDQRSGWLAGLKDNVVGPALARIHEQPAYPWTLATLARATASSRSVLAERFSELVGVPPMLYVTRWRLQLAAEQLARTTSKVAAIATRVGYTSEAAFSRAFKRETGMSPAAWRRARLA
jgi:AraC-like DNA-binding protein